MSGFTGKPFDPSEKSNIFWAQHLERLYLQNNEIKTIDPEAFVDLPAATSIHLTHNKLAAIRKNMLKGLHNITEISFSKNEIYLIEAFSFKHLSSAKVIDLLKNKLTIIGRDMFKGLHNINTIRLVSNSLNTIESGAFACVGWNTVSSGSKVFFDLSFNKLSTVLWNIFSNESKLNFQDFKSKSVSVFSNPLTCDINHCWLKELNIYVGHLSNVFKSDPCLPLLNQRCPTKNKHNTNNKDPSLPRLCTDNATECNVICKEIGYYAGEIHLNFGMCVSKHTCYCACENLSSDVCVKTCSQFDRKPVLGHKNEIGCNNCMCQCKSPNCHSVCFPYQFTYINNTYGCPECQCDCPDVDCDVQCGGEGIGIAVRDNLS